ncbi:MAG: hypothetical protein ACI9YE_000401 [Psychroserpens sp.]|jgi:hypothetical protein
MSKHTLQKIIYKPFFLKCLYMKVIKTQKGYFYKEYKNGKKVRISKENYLKMKKTIKQKGGETNDEVELQLKKLIYAGIYGKGDKSKIFGRQQVNQPAINSSLEKLKEYYITKPLLFNKPVNSHKENNWTYMVKNTKTSDRRFIGKTYREAILTACNDVFLDELIQKAIITGEEKNQIKQRAVNFTNTIIAAEEAAQEAAQEATEAKRIQELFNDTPKLEHSEVIGYVGILINGYFTTPQSIFYESILQWRKLRIEPVIFTDTRLETEVKQLRTNDSNSIRENKNKKEVGRWLKYKENIESIDLASANQNLLDWYYSVTCGKVGNERDDVLTEAQYMTFYSDLSRWYILNILNSRFQDKPTMFCQATWTLNVEKSNNYSREFIKNITNRNSTVTELIVYGMDRNLILDKQIHKRQNNTNTIYLICKGLDILTNVFLKRKHYQLIETIVITDSKKLQEMYVFGTPGSSHEYDFHIFYIIMTLISKKIKNHSDSVDEETLKLDPCVNNAMKKKGMVSLNKTSNNNDNILTYFFRQLPHSFLGLNMLGCLALFNTQRKYSGSTKLQQKKPNNRVEPTFIKRLSLEGVKHWTN